MLFGPSHSIRRAREARRRARLEERKRQKIMRATFSILAFVGLVITSFSMFELRRMKVRYEAAAAVAEASRVTSSEPMQDDNAPVTALEPGLEQLSREGGEIISRQLHLQSSSPSGKDGGGHHGSPLHMETRSSADRDQQVDGNGKSEGTDRTPKGDGESESGTGRIEENGGKREEIEDAGDGIGTLMDSLGDEEGGNGPIITLNGKSGSTGGLNTTNTIDKSGVASISTRMVLTENESNPGRPRNHG